MAKINHLNTAFSQLFFNPLVEIYHRSTSQRKSSSVSDLDFAVLGTTRCLSHTKTGHGFIQHHLDQGQKKITVDHFFKALKSRRRLANLLSLNTLLNEVMEQRTPDPFSDFEELQDFDFYAADGHYHHAAAFDPKPTEPGEKTISTGHFFRLNLRTEHMTHLDLSQPADGKKRDHDINVIKRVETDELRAHAKKGRKVLYAWDKACIDYEHWARLKQRGVYFVTQEKSNSAATQSSINLHHVQDPRNEGVQEDHLVDTSRGIQLRRIIYTDPSDEKTYTYLTSEFTLPAWAIVLLYKQRWVIEKVFHQFKSKMNERKSWASSPEAKRAHAIFECLAHNLSYLLECKIIKEQSMEDEVEKEKAKGREKSRRNREGILKKPADNFVNTAFVKASQRTQRFIRWIQVALYSTRSIGSSLERLRALWSECL